MSGNSGVLEPHRDTPGYAVHVYKIELSDPSDSELTVASQVVTRIDSGPGQVSAEFSVVIEGANGVPIQGATVDSGYWGPTVGLVSGVTDATGTVRMMSVPTTNNFEETWCFRIIGVSAPGLTWEPPSSGMPWVCEW